MKRSVDTLWRNADGAVAPMVALSLIALVAAGGIAFDYARVASMDTELQDAADQAALAAASQLDRQSGACVRAGAAAATLLTNQSRFANEGGGMAVAVPTGGITDCTGNTSIQFYQSYDQDTDTPGPVATDDKNARVVVVSVTPREAVYALTPIVAAFRSGNIGATAVAELDSAICKMPPVMICNPQETGGNTSFDPGAYIGDGLRLTSVGNGSGTWAPGNFGYLDTQTGVSGAPGLRQALGWNNPPGNCVDADGVDTKPGATTTVTDAMNTRFDIYQNNNTSCPPGGACAASINSIKDVRRPFNASGGNACKFVNNGSGWQLDTSGNGYYGNNAHNLPSSATTPTALTPSSMGSPRDMCHAISTSGSCANGRMGDGNWDRDAYFRTNYVRSVATANGPIGSAWTAAQWQTNTGLDPSVPRTAANYASRYNLYAWEEANRGTTVDGVVVLGPRNATASGNQLVSYGRPQCSGPQGYGTGQIPDSTTPDRRRISVAVVNCVANGVKGNSTGVPVEKWIDVFLVEPSLQRDRTNDGDMYVEIIGETKNAGQNASAVIVHQVPYLLK